MDGSSLKMKKKRKAEGEVEGGSDRLHELTVRYKAVRLAAGVEDPAQGCGTAGKRRRRTESLAPGGVGAERLRGLPAVRPFPISGGSSS